jgi:hypothetical protein
MSLESIQYATRDGYGYRYVDAALRTDELMVASVIAEPKAIGIFKKQTDVLCEIAMRLDPSTIPLLDKIPHLFCIYYAMDEFPNSEISYCTPEMRMALCIDHPDKLYLESSHDLTLMLICARIHAGEVRFSNTYSDFCNIVSLTYNGNAAVWDNCYSHEMKMAAICQNAEVLSTFNTVTPEMKWYTACNLQYDGEVVNQANKLFGIGCDTLWYIWCARVFKTRDTRYMSRNLAHLDKLTDVTIRFKSGVPS